MTYFERIIQIKRRVPLTSLPELLILEVGRGRIISNFLYKKVIFHNFLYEKIMFFNVFVEKVTFTNFCCIQKVMI